MEWWHAPALAALGLVAGVLNVMAGGGSLLTLPAMILFGMEPATANGTNRVALVAQNAVAVGAFAQRGFAELKRSLGLALCTIPGAIVGAFVAVEIDPEAFKRLLALVMVAVLVVTLWPRRARGAETGPQHPFLAHLGMLAVGFYGGFIQAGVGFLFMAIARATMSVDLVRINMHKVFVVGIYMLPSLAVFAARGHVAWLPGAALAVGTAAGGWLGTNLQISRGEGLVRAVFAVAVVAMAARLMLG